VQTFLNLRWYIDTHELHFGAGTLLALKNKSENTGLHPEMRLGTVLSFNDGKLTRGCAFGLVAKCEN